MKYVRKGLEFRTYRLYHKSLCLTFFEMKRKNCKHQALKQMKTGSIMS